MSDVADVPVTEAAAEDPAFSIQGRDVDGGFEELQRDRAFRRLAPPVLSREQLRSPLATPGKSPSTSTNPSVFIADATDDSSNEEELLPHRRSRRESLTSASSAKTLATIPSLTTPQELVNWCIGQAVSVTKLPFEQAPSVVSGQFAAFSAAFQEQVCCEVSPYFPLNHGQVTSLYRNQHKLVAEISRFEDDGDAPALASAKDFPVVCSADVRSAAALAYEAARFEALSAEDEEQRLMRLHSEYLSLCALCSQVDPGLASRSIMQDGSPIMQQV